MKHKLFLGVILLFQLLLFVNLQFSAWPEMVSFPYLLNHGFSLYGDMVHPYTPFLTLVLASLYKVFGYEIWVMKGLTWGMGLANTVIIYFIVKRFRVKPGMTINRAPQDDKIRSFANALDDKTPILSAGMYALLMPFLEGNMLWPDTAIVTPVLFGLLYLFNKQTTNKSLLTSGIFFATAVMIKQTAGLFLIAVSVYTLLYKRHSEALAEESFRSKFKRFFAITRGDIKRVLLFLLPSIFLGVVSVLYLSSNESLKWFLDWTLFYPSKYWTQVPGYVDLTIQRREWLILLTLFLPSLAGILKSKKIDQTIALFVLLIALSAVAIYPRFSFFHFQTGIALLTITSGYLFSRNKRLVGSTLVISSIILVYLVVKPALKAQFNKEDRFYSKSETGFANKIFQLTDGSKSVYFLGPHSGYYSLTGSNPVSPWVDSFPWYWEVPGFADEVLSKWDKNKPEYIVSDRDLLYPNTDQSNLAGYVHPKLAEWVIKNYEPNDSQGKITIWQKKD